jgi:hypothetical protein
VFKMGVLEPRSDAHRPGAQRPGRDDGQPEEPELHLPASLYRPGLQVARGDRAGGRESEALQRAYGHRAGGAPTILGLTESRWGAARSADVCLRAQYPGLSSLSVRTFEREVFARLLEQEGIAARVHLRWGDLSEPDKLSRARRLGVMPGPASCRQTPSWRAGSGNTKTCLRRTGRVSRNPRRPPSARRRCGALSARRCNGLRTR